MIIIFLSSQLQVCNDTCAAINTYSMNQVIDFIDISKYHYFDYRKNAQSPVRCISVRCIQLYALVWKGLWQCESEVEY